MKKSRFSNPVSPKWLEACGPYVALIAAVFAAYVNVYHNAFFCDDEHLILQNQFLGSWHYLPTLFTTSLTAGENIRGAYYRPFQQLIYMIVFQSAGLSTIAFHLVNVALHAANAGLMYRLGRKLNFQPIAVFLATLLWALHPIQTEAVTYVSATADTLYTFFCLAGVLVLLPDLSPRRIGIACLFFIGALLSKENAIAFPILAAAMLYYTSKKRMEAATYLRLWPLVAIAVVYVGLHSLLLSFKPEPAMPVAAASAISGLMTFAPLPYYLRLLLWPAPLYMEHMIDAHAIGLALGGFVLVILSMLQIVRKQAPNLLPLSWGLIWFFGALLPVSYVKDILYEHWMYLPTVGLFLGVAQCAFLSLKGRGNDFLKWSAPAVLVLACILGFMTWTQNEIWHDPVVFYNHIIEQGQPAPRAHLDLGVYYARQGDYGIAFRQYEIASHEFDLSSDSFTVDNRAALENDIAETLLKLPDGDTRQDEALRHLRKAVAIDPDYYPALEGLADLYAQRGDKKQAEFYQEKIDKIQ